AMDEEALWHRLNEKNAKIPEHFSNQRTEGSEGLSYKDWVSATARPEECGEDLYAGIWDEVNEHLGTEARGFPELVEQLGIMRFGRRPKVADVFCGSGQIPFEAARLGCDTYASDLNPIACMLTWGAFNIVGASAARRKEIEQVQSELARKVQAEIDALEIEQDGKGWRAKVYLYCLEARCPQSGWLVPLLPSLVISKGYKVVARLEPDPDNKRYKIEILEGVSDEQLKNAESGTIRDGEMIHAPDGVTFYRTKISTLRGDYTENGQTRNRLRMWEKHDFIPRPNDLFQERLYCVQWMRPKKNSNRDEYQFRAITASDLTREQNVINFVSTHLAEWQEKGWIPDMVIEPGDKTDEPIRTRGWTYWHHLFNPRQLLITSLLRQNITAVQSHSFASLLNYNSKLCRWDSNPGPGRVGKAQGVFDNQALNTLYNYAVRGSAWNMDFFLPSNKIFPLNVETMVKSHPAEQIEDPTDFFITDPPYGDAVKYEEITEFFIAWLRKNPPKEFADWTWDSRRVLAIKGEDDDFRKAMVDAYGAMTACMSDNGLQVIMFTHQSGSIWADMANIVWASGLQVTAAWYVVTESDSALRGGNNVKGTVLLVLRKRQGEHKTNRGDLGWELKEETEAQVHTLTGLNQDAKGLYRDQNLFSDADLQMAGYAAALRVLTRYTWIDGKDMRIEATRPKVKGTKTMVEELIDFAVETANGVLVPLGIEQSLWDKLTPGERFYLKMLDMEAQGYKTLDNYQNFAKAFKVPDYRLYMQDDRANHAALKSSADFGRVEMTGTSELAGTRLRGLLYALMELGKDTESDLVLEQLGMNVNNYFNVRPELVDLSDYLSHKLEGLRPEEASQARVLRDLLRHQKLGAWES
ncbi:MAG: DNA methylase, partial [Spirochaetia bacterium]|nr:DNA methylase [Spirochaetia bacterium]